MARLRRQVRGITLLELLAALVVAGMLVSSLAMAFSTSLRAYLRSPDALDRVDEDRALEKRLTNLISRAWVSSGDTDQTSYFIAGNGDEQGIGSSDSASEITFTVLGEPISAPAMSAQDLTFEERNERFGPLGGVTEVRIGTSPIGDAGDATGMFLRRQTPSDEDPLQGGEEELLDSRISDLTFEFWDGQEWLGQWDTTTDERRVPSAIKLTYTISEDDAERQRVLVIRLANSDISSAVPLGSGGGNG